MKIALYIEDGLEQIVLTPASEAEKDILDRLHQHGRALEIYRGELYPRTGSGQLRASPESSIIVLHPIGGTAPPPSPKAAPRPADTNADAAPARDPAPVCDRG